MVKVPEPKLPPVTTWAEVVRILPKDLRAKTKVRYVREGREEAVGFLMGEFRVRCARYLDRNVAETVISSIRDEIDEEPPPEPKPRSTKRPGKNIWD